jgi:hypothetical protein
MALTAESLSCRTSVNVPSSNQPGQASAFRPRVEEQDEASVAKLVEGQLPNLPNVPPAFSTHRACGCRLFAGFGFGVLAMLSMTALGWVRGNADDPRAR